ncbi:deoxyribonuclease IV [Nitrososphaera viennensis]|uniref:Probable endonuclease 4 n=2 Tax=Nitrososphaera viennensis TaxID=1034015 RepID=A0A060HHG5_9ARCH|nr:deoxyribonuclease IV [Nitrososphaera viennensis]AIC14790.1 putative endonuclease 4 [Nitrososphaera viennensis EN76]UVS69745.1 deoxyribonuclease IV [Nitrososphaera viennensis]
MNAGYKVGFHVSIAGGISNSVDNAKGIGCSAFQIFSRNPRGWAAKPLAPGDVAAFKDKMAASGIDRTSTVVHMPYLPNLSGPAGEMYAKSVDTLAGEIQRAGELGIPYLVIHLGSHLGKGSEAGMSQLVNAITTARDRAKKKGEGVTVLLENNAGQKNSIGATFEELRAILDRLDSSGVGVCLDTCHAFASGYDLRTAKDVEKTLGAFDKTIGLKELKVVHLNDSKGPLGSNLDRHEHIGLGSIGREGIAAFLCHKAIASLPIIMETPIDEKRDDAKNLKAFCELVS